MTLSSAARIAQSGLGAASAAMSLLSRNITGAGDPAYARKTAVIAGTASGPQLIGVSRASNLALFGNVLVATAVGATKDTLMAGLDRLATTLGDETSGAGSPANLLAEFTNALQAYESSPSDSNAAAGAVSAAKAVTDALNAASATVQRERALADADMARSVQSVNALLDRIRVANERIVKGAALHADVTDAWDQRDALVRQLSQEIGVTTSTGADSDLSIYTDSGVPLFQGGRPRTVTFTATSTYAPTTSGNPVLADGVPLTGGSAAMAIMSGKLAGAALLRDEASVTYQAQLDAMASELVDMFAETDRHGSAPDLPGLFTWTGATGMPPAIPGLAARLSVNPNVDPARGGSVDRLRDGGISDPANPGYIYNTDGHAGYTGRIAELLGKLSARHSFDADGSLPTEATLADYAATSVSWLSAERAKVSAERDYQNALVEATTSAFSNTTGVNLDAEMSKLIDLEQSYAATAKLITAIDRMFDTLVNAT